MKQKELSELEKYIMDIVWEKKECSVRDALENMKKKRSIAYTTIATIFQRLENKGFVYKRESGLAYVYKPKFSKEKYSKTVAQSFLHTFINSFGDTAIASFAESVEELPKEKRDYFLKLLESHEKHK